VAEGKSKTLLGAGSKGHIVLRAAPGAAPVEGVPICVMGACVDQLRGQGGLLEPGDPAECQEVAGAMTTTTNRGPGRSGNWSQPSGTGRR